MYNHINDADTSQKKLWKDRIAACQDWQELDDEYYPRVLTIDASQGQEATMVIMDGTLDYRDMLSGKLP